MHTIRRIRTRQRKPIHNINSHTSSEHFQPMSSQSSTRILPRNLSIHTVRLFSEHVPQSRHQLLQQPLSRNSQRTTTIYHRNIHRQSNNPSSINRPRPALHPQGRKGQRSCQQKDKTSKAQVRRIPDRSNTNQREQLPQNSQKAHGSIHKAMPRARTQDSNSQVHDSNGSDNNILIRRQERDNNANRINHLSSTRRKLPRNRQVRTQWSRPSDKTQPFRQ